MKKYTYVLLSLLLLVVFIFTINYATNRGEYWVVADCLLMLLSIVCCIKAIRSNESKIAGGLAVTMGILIVITFVYMLIIGWLLPFGG